MKPHPLGLTIILTLIGIQMSIVGLCKIVGLGPFLAEMAALHYSAAFARFLGVCEVLGVIGLTQTRFRLAALLCFLVLVIGAIGSHFGAGQGVEQAAPAIVSLVLIVLALWLNSSAKLRSLFAATAVNAPAAVLLSLLLGYNGIQAIHP